MIETQVSKGIINTYFEKLQSNGLLVGEVYEQGKIYIIDFSTLPIINRKMVKTVSAKELFAKQLQVETIKGKNKVFKVVYDCQNNERG